MMTFILFVAVVALLIWAANLSNRIGQLEKRAGWGVVPEEYKRPVSPQDYQKLSRVPVSSEVPLPHPAAPESVLSAIPSHEPSREETEVAAGWLSKIGIVAVLFGVAFFLKYAIDQGWIGQWSRIILGLVTGGLLITLGELWKNRYEKYAALLTGGGIALLYFSIFAAYQFYSLIPQALAFAIMVAITACGIWLSYRYRSMPLAVLAIAGAYLSPILIHSAIDQQLPLFLYLALLSVGALAVLYRYFWVELLFFSYIGIVLDFVLWAANFSNHGNIPLSAGFVLFEFMLFALVPALLFRRHKSGHPLPPSAGHALALLQPLLAIFLLAGLYVLMHNDYHSALPLLGFAGAVVALLSYAVVDRLEHEEYNYSVTLAAAVILICSVFWQYGGFPRDFVLVLLGLVGVAGGVAARRSELRFWGVMVSLFSALMALFAPYDKSGYVFLTNEKFILMMVQAASFLCQAWLMAHAELVPREKNFVGLSLVTGLLFVWFGVSWELVKYFTLSSDSANARNLLLSLWWIFYAAVLIVIGVIKRYPLLRKLAIALFGVSIVKVFLYDVGALELGYRVVSFIVLGVILLSVSFYFQKNKEVIKEFLEVKK